MVFRRIDRAAPASRPAARSPTPNRRRPPSPQDPPQRCHHLRWTTRTAIPANRPRPLTIGPATVDDGDCRLGSAARHRWSRRSARAGGARRNGSDTAGGRARVSSSASPESGETPPAPTSSAIRAIRFVAEADAGRSAPSSRQRREAAGARSARRVEGVVADVCASRRSPRQGPGHAGSPAAGLVSFPMGVGVAILCEKVCCRLVFTAAQRTALQCQAFFQRVTQEQGTGGEADQPKPFPDGCIHTSAERPTPGSRNSVPG